MGKKQLAILSVIAGISLFTYNVVKATNSVQGSSNLTYIPANVSGASVGIETPKSVQSGSSSRSSSLPSAPVKVQQKSNSKTISKLVEIKSQPLPQLRTNLSIQEQKKVVPEYFAINQAIVLYEGGKYVASVSTLQTIVDKMDSKDPMLNYTEYLLAKSYFQSGEYTRAIEWAKKTEYAPYEMQELLSLSYLNLGREEMSDKYDKELFINGYKASATLYEKRALQRLAANSNYYKIVISVMYDENFSKLSQLTTPDLQKISNYFIGVSDYKSALAVDNELINRDNDFYIKEQKLYLLYALKQYVTAENYGLQLINERASNACYYYIGLSYQRQGNLTKATEFISKMQGATIETEKNQLLGRYAYLQKNYAEAIPYLKNQSDSSSLEMLIECYEKIGNIAEANNAKQRILNEYPTLDLCAFYRYQAYESSKDTKYLQQIIRYNLNSYYYEYALENLKISAPVNDYPIVKVHSEYSTLTLQVEALLSMKFYQGANMLIQNSGIASKNIFYYIYLQTQVNNAQGNYGSSVNLAVQNFRAIYQYSNFIPLIFPNYYFEAVNLAAKKTGVSPALIYAIIRQESAFNRGAISSASAYGLMQLTVPTARGYDPDATREKLLDASYNIDLGSQNIAKLMKRFNGNILKVAAAYNAGPGAVARWEKENPNLLDRQIPYQETQNYVRKIINNYDKYSRLYYSDSNMVGKYLVLPPAVTSPLIENGVSEKAINVQ